MCGFAGLVADPAAGIAADRLEAIVARMSATLVHRGPDDEGSWCDAAAGLAFGHRRLSILDLSPAGHQPMSSACGRYTIVYNGEIYELSALTGELERHGHRFRGHSDTEVLLAAVVQWGIPGALARLTGMFAFALWDRDERVLHLVRDRLGKKPLYCGWVGRDFVFASELKAIRAHPAFAGEIDREALTLYLRFGYVPTPYSIYGSVRKLPAGSFVSLRADELRPGIDAAAAARSYWSASGVAEAAFADPFRGGDEEAVDELDALLRRAVDTRRHADVPLGVFLSGGIDSSTVTGILQAGGGEAARTFSIAFEQGWGEARHARRVAEHLGTVHTEFCVGAAEMLAAVPRLPALFDEPFSDSSQIPTYLLAREARRQVTVAVTGDGGDELFFGYRRYLRGVQIWRHLDRTPRPVRRGLAAAVRAASHLGPRESRAAALVQDLRADSVDAMFRNRVSHFSDPVSFVPGGGEPQVPFDRIGASLRHADPAQRMMLLDLVSYLTDDILVKVDRATMAVGLEARSPLLDHRVVELALRLPVAMKLRDGRGKWVLRQVLARYVPAGLTERPKYGFGAPVRAWLAGPLRDWAAALLDGRRLRSQGYFETAPVERLWRAAAAGHRESAHRVWDLLMFQAWLDA